MYDTEKLLDLAPELNGLDEGTLQMGFETASVFVSRKQFGKAYDLALIYLTAHLLTLRKLSMSEGASSGGVTKEVTSEHEGALSRSYGTSLSSDAFLAKTIYGIMFERIKRRVIIPVLTRMG